MSDQDNVVSAATEGNVGRIVALAGPGFRTPAAGAIVATLMTFVVFSFWAESFFTYAAATSYLTISSELGIIAVGVAALMIAGEFDLSVGSVLALSSSFVPLLMTHGVPAIGAILLGFLVAALIGLSHGLIVTRTLIPSFIVTLASLMFWRGVVLIMTKGFPVSVDQSQPLFKIFSSNVHELQVSVFWFVSLALILTFVLTRMVSGNWIYATGGSALAAQKSGIPTNRVKIALFMLTSMLAALAGMIQMTRFASVDPLVGQGIELTVIAAAVIGGTSLRGGFGSIVGAAFGCLTFGMIQVGLQLASVPGYFFQSVVGLILLAAMIIQIYTSKVFRASR